MRQLSNRRGVDQILDRSGRPTSTSVVIIAMELGKGLLEERHPHGFVSARVREVGLASGSHQVVINDNGGGDTEGVHVHAVDSFFVLHILRVDELAHQALRLLGDS